MAAGAAGPGAHGGARAVMEAGREWADRLDSLYSELYRLERGGGHGARAGEIRAEIRREKATLARARIAVHELVALAGRDASRRADLFAATTRAMSMSPVANDHDAGLAIVIVAVLLDAGRPLPIGEVERIMYEERGKAMSEGALYMARFSGAVDKDSYDVLHLKRPVGHGAGGGEEWMYEALEGAVSLGAARYTASGIEVVGGAAGLAGRELAGAGAVAAGVNAYGETPGLAAWLDRNRRCRGGATWAEATVVMRLARAEVGAAWARVMARRAPAAAPGRPHLPAPTASPKTR